MHDANQFVARLGWQARGKTDKCNVKNRLHPFGDFVRTTGRDWQPDKRETVTIELVRAIEHVDAARLGGLELDFPTFVVADTGTFAANHVANPRR